MVDVKCKGCNKTLLKANILVGAVKCPRCKMIFEYYITSNTLYESNNYDTAKVLHKH